MCRTKGARAQYSIEREDKILSLLATDKDYDEIAAEVFVSPDYLYSLVKGLWKRYNVKARNGKRRAELVRIYQEKKEVA